ncbi:glycosyltransferase [Synechococcus sp. MU1643]|uniref:glycosyltransferase n=1 Tax=Synechococcus sp. MU1643 TaxID=2508349 RepID=UPI001CF8586B|nr:glycosyltransferase [Synechococcus sp. MU1643]MCB4429147.1 glycosyltransferase [Synechococcus sp. MU1643]
MITSIQESEALFTTIRVLVPGTSSRFRCGGLSVAKQTVRLLSALRPTTLVTYRERADQHPFIEELLKEELVDDQCLWIISWGFDVPRLLKRLRGRNVIYHAHSSGYGFKLPPSIPIVAVSRNTMGYWGHHASRNPLFFIPNALESQWIDRGDLKGDPAIRPIDILVQKRKSSNYLLFELVPALRAKGLRVEVQSDWVEDIVHLFNNSKVFLYDSTEHWSAAGLTEGFGLPPVEAMACGCIVFSSLNHALSDILTPGEIGHQIGCGSLSNDVNRIIAAVYKPSDWKSSSSMLELALRELSEESHVKRWKDVLQQIDQLVPIFNESNFIKQRSRLRIISIKVFNKFRFFITKLQGVS